MSKPNPDTSSPRVIEERAAEWFGRVELGLGPAEQVEFTRWLEADPRHAEAFRTLDEVWERLDGLNQSRRFRRHRARRRMIPLLLAAAAVVVLGLVFLPGRGRVEREFVTAADGLRRVDLPDGSVMRLNASSRAIVAFDPHVRRIMLREGEASFAVAKDPAHPFEVIAGEVAVKAVGTEFNVRHGARGIEVLVAEGKVRVDSVETATSLLNAGEYRPRPAAAERQDAPLLVAGQSALVPLVSPAGGARTAVVTEVAPEELARARAWQSRQLEFDQMPLTEVVATFNRYNSRQLVIADEALGRRLFGGAFRSDNEDVLVRLLEDRFNVVAERDGDRTLLHLGSDPLPRPNLDEGNDQAHLNRKP